MITPEKILKCYKEGIDFKISRDKHPEKACVEYDPSELEVKIYFPYAKSLDNLRLSTLWGFAHAWKDIMDSKDISDETAMEEAISTYDKYDDDIFKFISEIYPGTKSYFGLR